MPQIPLLSKSLLKCKNDNKSYILGRRGLSRSWKGKNHMQPVGEGLRHQVKLFAVS